MFHTKGDVLCQFWLPGLGDFVLELVEDLDLECPRVVGNSGLGVSVVSVAFSTWVFL